MATCTSQVAIVIAVTTTVTGAMENVALTVVTIDLVVETFSSTGGVVWGGDGWGGDGWGGDVW
ncbi:MAG: hypothetical protein NVSMB4_19900 [Acidimicrobiales bacterium]